MRLVGLSLRNLASRPLRSGLTALGIGVAVGSSIALVGTSRGLTDAWRKSLAERGTHMIAVRKGAVEPMTASVDQTVRDQLRRVEGVEAVAGELADLLALDADRTIIAAGWDPEEYLWQGLPLREGAMPGPDQPHGVVLGDTMAEGLSKTVGDTLRIEEQEFVVTGITQFAGALNRSAMIMPLAAMQTLMGQPGKVNVVNLRLRGPHDPAGVAELKQRLTQLFPTLRFAETSEVGDNSHMFRFLRAIAWSTSAIALLMGTLVVLNTLLMSVTEQTYDIGVLSAIGWPAGRILGMILIEGLILAAAGSVVGTVLGLGILRWLGRLPLIRGLLEVQVGARLVLEVVAAALLIGTVGSLYPAWRAVRLKPVDALREE